MALSGGTVRNPRTGAAVKWRPVGPVVDEFATIKNLPGYTCLGVIGNSAHLAASQPGDHTPYSTHCVTV